MMMGLSTGFFIWNILSWLFIFLFTAFILCVVVYIAVKRGAGRIVHIPPALEKRGFALWGFESVLCGFRESCVEPFLSSPLWHIAAIAAIAVLLCAAVFSGNGKM